MPRALDARPSRLPPALVGAGVLALAALAASGALVVIWQRAAVCAATPDCRSNAGIAIVVGQGFVALACALSCPLALLSDHPARKYVLGCDAIAIVALVVFALALAP
ncbi:MAG: hypothetical protein HYZ29_18230 [Myxococcales bacterium]|nr:hypothetical protein [Myxococcales bacterium]